MGEINIARSEQEALKAIDVVVLDHLIDQCLSNGVPYALQSFGLSNCGLFVSSKLRRFEEALLAYRQAKAPKKRSETQADALRAGSDLLNAVQQMKTRVKTEEQQADLFYIDDHIQSPFSFTERLTVTVHYRWRSSTGNEWLYASIEFSHKFDPRPDYLRPQPMRKRSVAQQSRDRQDELHEEWEHLRKLALWSLRDYFQGGGDGARIPKVFQVKADAQSRGLNNFSANFWSECP